MRALTRIPVCESCWTSVRAYTGIECQRCGLFLENSAPLQGTGWCRLCRREAFAFDQARTYGWYQGALRKLVQALKYAKMLPVARQLSGYLEQAMQRLDQKTFDLIVPVPLHRNRERLRGFNQSRVLARQLAARSGIELSGRECIRVRDTRPQTGLRSSARRSNVAGAFAVPVPKSVRGKRLLLIDDVMTTGATLNACAQALVSAGALGVWGLAVARARPAWMDVL